MWHPWKHRKLIGANPEGAEYLGRSRALFKPIVDSLRPLVLLIDAELTQKDVTDPKTKYLLEPAAVLPIQAHLYSKTGPPLHHPKIAAIGSGIRAHEGWAVAEVSSEWWYAGATIVRSGTPEFIPMRIDASEAAWLRQQFSLEGSTNADIDADLRVLLTAKAIRADFYVTERPLTVNVLPEYWRNTEVLSSHQALPIVGLYLRSLDHYVYSQRPPIGSTRIFQPETVYRDRSTFFYQASRALLPYYFAWSSAYNRFCDLQGVASKSPDSESILWRINQAIRSRDRLLRQLSVVPIEHAPVDDILSELDQILIYLNAAFDISARVAHQTQSGKGSQYSAGWLKEDWIGSLSNSSELQATLSKGSDGCKLLWILSRFRNQIHETAFSGGGTIFVAGPNTLDPMFPIPEDLKNEVLSYMDSLGGRDAWGVKGEFMGRIWIHPGDFAEQLLSRSLPLLSSIMSQTRIGESNTRHVNKDELREPLSPHEQRLIWQLGIEESP